jgi:hypothetical protein
MQVRQSLTDARGQGLDGWVRVLSRLRAGCASAALAVLAVSSGANAVAQQSPPPRPPHPILLPEANRPPDANDQMLMRERQKRQKNFDEANTIRAKEIAGDAANLLILARDLKAEMDRLGDNPLTPRLMREAEVIELLARDVQTKMKLTVGGG